ncbi:MAG: DUF1559 domain-containing protein [Pirellulales bacterium]
MFCPSRRPPTVLTDNPNGHAKNVATPVFFQYWDHKQAAGDYAVNAGEIERFWVDEDYREPKSYKEGDTPGWPWQDLQRFSGISGTTRSQIRIADVDDGLSNTYLVGESFRYIECYSFSASCQSFNLEAECSPLGPTFADQRRAFGVFGIQQDRLAVEVGSNLASEDLQGRFGSAHNSACHIAFGDGSVRSISYSVDLAVHRRLTNRQDGQPIPGDLW